jgi:hypothetical protein
VAHTCNPSCSGDRDQKDHGLTPAWANSSQDPILKKTFTEKKKRGGELVERFEVYSLSSSLSTAKEKKRKKEKKEKESPT